MKYHINWSLLIASIVMSVLLWMVVGTQTSQIRIVTVDVKSQGADTDKFYIKQIPDSINATLRGTQSQLNELTPDSIQAFVDLSLAKAGRNPYPIRIFPDQARQLVSEFPKTVLVDIEPIIQRDLAVTVESSGELSEAGYVLENAAANPPRVTIRGPKSEVDQIDKVRAVLPLGQVDARRTAPFILDVIALTKENRPMGFVRCIPLQVSVSPSLSVASVDKTVFVNGIFTGVPGVGFQTQDYSFEPPQVSVNGSSATMARLTRINTEPVDISGLTGTTTVEVALAPPVGVRVRPRTVRVTIRIEPKKLPASEPTVPPPNQ